MSLICLFTCVFLKAHLLLHVYASPCLFSRYMSRIPVTSFNLVSSHGFLKLSYTEERKWFQKPQNKCTFDIVKGGEKMCQNVALTCTKVQIYTRTFLIHVSHMLIG